MGEEGKGEREVRWGGEEKSMQKKKHMPSGGKRQGIFSATQTGIKPAGREMVPCLGCEGKWLEILI